MSEKKDTTKDLVVGGAAILAVAANAPALIAAAAGTLVAVGWNHVTNSAQRRAQKLLERMIERDEEPASFAEHVQQRLESGDEDTLTAFRTLITNAVQAISPDALAPMGFVGRSYFRGMCTLQLARASIEFFNNVTATDLQNLRQLTSEVAALDGDRITIVTDVPVMANNETRGWRAWPDDSPTDQRAIHVPPFGDPISVFTQLKRAGLGWDSGGYGIAGSPRAIVMTPDAIRLLRDALTAGAAGAGG